MITSTYIINYILKNAGLDEFILTTITIIILVLNLYRKESLKLSEMILIYILQTATYSKEYQLNYLLSVILLCFFIVYNQEPSLQEELKNASKTKGIFIEKILITILITSVFSMVYLTIIEQLNLDIINVNQQLSEEDANFFSVVIKAPIVEEYIFRKGVFNKLRKQNNPIIKTALIFAVPHIIISFFYIRWGALFLLPAYLIPSVLLTKIYSDTESIIAPVVVHMINNFLSFI